MKFDTAKAMEQARAFAGTRIPGTEEDRRAAERVERVFQNAGYQVERSEVVGDPRVRNRRLALAWIGFGSFFPMGLLRPASSYLLARLGLMGLGLSCLVVIPRLYDLIPVGRKFRRTETLVARRSTPTDPPVRVVFLTALDSPPVFIPGRPYRVSSAVLCATVVMVWTANLMFGWLGEIVHPAVFSAIIAAFEASLFVWHFSRTRPSFGRGDADNRDGLATLIELARTWPERTDERIETRFVAAGGQTLDLAGLKALERAIQTEWSRKPTLVVGIWSPGLGPPFEIDHNSLAASEATLAAEELWIPHQRQVDLFSQPLWPVGTGVSDFVAVVGANGPPIRPESLSLAAQLVTEVALRWAKQQTAPQDEGSSFERSSQNPG